MYIQIYEYLNKILSKWQCGFRQSYSAQHCLLIMVEKWRQWLDNGGVSGALLTDLSKAFDCKLHDLLIAELAAYGFDHNSLQMLQSYLSNRKQRTKINDAYSKYCEILFGVPQGSILGPLLFNIYICDMFYDIDDCDIASNVDDNTPYASSSNLDALINKLEESTNNLFQWFRNNYMKANAGNATFWLQGISIDTTLSFEHHITSLCKKASQKLHALARIAHYTDFEKRRSLMKAFVISQFNYCPLIWMFHNRALNNRINKIHERALRLVYQNKNLSFSELLELDNAVTIHQRNLQVLVTEIFKVKNNLSPEIMKQVFDFQEPYYNLRSETSQFRRENIKTTHYGIQSVKFLGPKIWAMVPQNIKKCKSLQEFKKLMKV